MSTAFLKTALAATWIWVFNLLLPVGHFMMMTMLLVVADFITGITAARHRGEALRSKGFRRTVLKTVLYCLAILLSHGMDMVFFQPKNLSFDLVWIVAGLIGLAEFKSNLENIAVVTGVDIWARIADRIPGLPKIPKEKE